MKKWLILLLLLASSNVIMAKVDTLSVRRVVEGNEVRYTYKLRENGRIYTQEEIISRPNLNPEHLAKENISLLVSKTNFRVYLMYKKQPLKAYRAVFGSGGYLEDKLQEGDKKTPEGHFKIKNIRPHGKWHYFLELDYPNMESQEKFQENKRNKKVPEGARIGGAIGIHGTFDNQDGVVDSKFNWTDGCISMKNSDLTELLRYVQVGTPVTIIK